MFSGVTYKKHEKCNRPRKTIDLHLFFEKLTKNLEYQKVR